MLISGIISAPNSVVNTVYASVPNDGTKQYQHSLQGGLHVSCHFGCHRALLISKGLQLTRWGSNTIR